MSKLNLFGRDWTNIVFDGRNKLYGAYKLRQESNKTTLLALFIGIGTLSAVFGSSYLYASKNSEIGKLIDYPIERVVTIKIDVEADKLKVISKESTTEKNNVTTTAKAAARTDVQKNIKYTEMIVEKDANVKNDVVASQKDFTDAIQSGKNNREADLKNGNFKSNGELSGISKTGVDGKKQFEKSEDGEDVTNSVFKLVQHKASPFEGREKFYENFSRRFSASSLNGNVNEIIVKLSFVVEKDGSFTDVKIIEDDLGLGKDAIRVLMAMPKWKPAEHNGRTVRSMFTLPIKIRINN